MLAPTDWTDAEILAAAAQAAREEFFGAQRARVGDTGAQDEARGGGVPFLLVRKQLVRLLDEMGVGLQSTRGLQVYRHLLQHVVQATVGECGHDMILFSEESRALFMPPVNGAGGTAASRLANANSWSLASSPSVVSSGPAPVLVSASPGPSGLSDRSFNETTPRVSASSSSAPSSSSSSSPVSFSPSSGPVSSSSTFPPSSSSACPSSSSSSSSSSFSSCSSCSSSPLASATARVQAFAARRKAGEDHRLLLDALREWRRWAAREARLRSLFWTLSSRRRLRALRRSLHAWRANFIEALSRREDSNEEAADGQRTAAVCRRSLLAWSAGVETQSAEARGQVARAAPAEEGCQRYEALQTSFRSWREATVAQREAERQRRLLSAFKAWKESHLSRRVRKQVLEHRAFAVQKSLQDRHMRGVWRYWRAAAEARSRAGAAARETLERTRFRRVFNALLAETRDRQTRRGAAVAAAEATVRERRVRRAFRAWRKVSILRRPPFAAGHSQFSSPQIVCLLKAVSALRREGASEEPGHARSLGEALLDAATARQRRERAQRRGDRDGEETELGRDAQVDLEDAALLTLIPLHGIDLHLPKLSTAAPLMAQALRQHYLRHSFLQWRAEALRQRQFRQAARVSRLARVFRAWREETQKAKGEAAASSAVYAAQKTRILREAWRSWRMRFRRYVLFRTQCRSLQDLRLLHLKSLAFRGWCTFHRERQREAQSVSAVKDRAAAALQRAAWSRWQEAWHLRRRRRAMAEAAALLREKTLLAKGLRGLKRQRASAASLRDAAAALRQERLGLALAVWWRWAARRGAFQELCELQRAKRARRNLRRLLLAWRSLAKRMETRRDAVWRLAAVVDRIRVRRGFCGWNALRMQERKREEAASRLQRTLRDARIRAAWAAWRSAQSLACKEAELRKESEDSLKRRVFKQWQAAAAEHATLQLHLRGQLLCWRLSRLLHRWRRLATLFRLGLLQKSRSRLYVLRRCQEAWLARLAERSEERRKEARAESLCLTLRLRAAQRCLLAWQETAVAVAARRRKGDTFRAQLHRARLDAAWTTWRRGVEELHRRRRLLLGVEKIREKILVAQSLTRWKCAAALLRKEALATQARRQALLRRALQAWTLWRRRRTEKKDEAERVRACLNEEGSAKRAGERQRKKETLAAWHALTEKRFEERRAFSRVEAIGDRLSLRRGFVTWRLWALRLAGLSQATVRLDVWRRRCLLRISYEALSQHRDRVKEMELASLAHLSQLRAQTLRRSFCSWRTQFAALRREAEVLARRRSAAARAEAHAALACKRRSFLAWLKALAAKLALKKRLFVLLKERREALEARTLRAWRRLAKKKGDLRESLEMFSDSRRSQCLRRVFAAVFATVSRRRLVRVRFLFALGLLAPSPDFSVSSAESSHPHSRSLLLPLSPLGPAEEASLRLLWGPALPAPLLAPRLIPRLPGPSRAFESAKECPSVLASLPLVPRLIVWSAQPHMLHLLLLQPAIAESLARQAGQQPQRSAAFFEPLPVSRARLALFSDADAEARTRVWGLPAASLGGEETPGGDKGNGALPLAALASARSRPPSVWSCLTPSTCTPHTSLSVPLSGFEAPPPRPGRTFFRTETGDTLGSARSQFRGRSASPLHSDGPSGREAGSRRHRSATKERDREDREEIDELLLADKKSSKSLERLLRCFSAKQGPEGPLKENAELWGEQAVLADSVRRMRPQNDLQALLLAQVNLSRRPSVQRPAPLFLPSAMGPDAAVSDALDASQDSVESDGSAGGLSVHSEETPLPSKNWREEIPVDLLATAWQFARLLQAALRAWLLQAQRHKAQRLRETGLVAGFRIQSRSRLLAACWGLWRSTKSSLEARTRTKAQRLAWGIQRRVLQAWFLCATVDASAVLRAEAFAETRRSAKTHAMLEAWRGVATKRRQEREQVEAWRQHRARERKQELFALWTHLASVNRAGAQLYVHRRAATLNKVFATWRTSTLRSLALDKLQRIVSRPGLFLGFSLLRIWSLTRACSLRLAAQCLDSWRQHTESRKRLAGLLVYVQTVHKVSRLQQHFSAWLLVQQRRRRLLLLHRTAEAAAFLLPLHRIFSRWRASALDRQAQRDSLLGRFLAQRQRPFLALDPEESAEAKDAGRLGTTPSCAYWARWRIEETWKVWRRRFRLRTLLRRRATRCARTALSALRQAVERRRALEAFERKRRQRLLQRATVAWQVYVQRRLLKQQRTAHAIERYNTHTLRQAFSKCRWLLQRLQWERGVIEVSQAKANRRVCRMTLQALQAYAEARVAERERLDGCRAARSSHLLRMHFEKWSFLLRATHHAASLSRKTSFLLWTRAFRRSRGAALLVAVQRRVEERQTRRGLAALQAESEAFEQIKAFGAETPWLRDAIEEKVSSARASMTFALSSLRLFAAHRVSRRRQARLLAGALASWARLQETDGPRRRLRPYLRHWRGALQYRLHLQAAEEALRRHVEFRRLREVWGAWRHLRREEARGRELLALAEETKKVWALEKGILLLHEHRLQREWMTWCTYRAELFVTDTRHEKARLCVRAWHSWVAKRRELRRRGLEAQEASRLFVLSNAFSALRCAYTRRTALRAAGACVVEKQKRSSLRTAWRGWRKVLVDLLALKPRLEALLARQAFQRVCLAWWGWRMWHQRRKERRQLLGPLSEKARVVRDVQLAAQCFRGWAELAETRATFWRQREGLVEKLVARRLTKETFRAWRLCAREIHFVRSTKAAAANAAALAAAGHGMREMHLPAQAPADRRGRPGPSRETTMSPASSLFSSASVSPTASRRNRRRGGRSGRPRGRDLLSSSLSLSDSQPLERLSQASDRRGGESQTDGDSGDMSETVRRRPGCQRPSEAAPGSPPGGRSKRVHAAAGRRRQGAREILEEREISRLARSAVAWLPRAAERSDEAEERALRRRSASAVFGSRGRDGESGLGEMRSTTGPAGGHRAWESEASGEDTEGEEGPRNLQGQEAEASTSGKKARGTCGLAVSFSLGSPLSSDRPSSPLSVAAHEPPPPPGKTRLHRVSSSLSSPRPRGAHAKETPAGPPSSPSSASSASLRQGPRQLRLQDLLSDSSSSLASAQPAPVFAPQENRGKSKSDSVESPSPLTVATSLLEALSHSHSSALAEAARSLLLQSGARNPDTKPAASSRDLSESDRSKSFSSADSEMDRTATEDSEDDRGPQGGRRGVRRRRSSPVRRGDRSRRVRREEEEETRRRSTRRRRAAESEQLGEEEDVEEVEEEEVEEEEVEEEEGVSGVEVSLVEKRAEERIRVFPRAIREAPPSAFALPSSLSSLFLTSLQGAQGSRSAETQAREEPRVGRVLALAHSLAGSASRFERGGDEDRVEDEGQSVESARLSTASLDAGERDRVPRKGGKRDHPFFFSLMSSTPSLRDQASGGQSSCSSSPASPSSESSVCVGGPRRRAVGAAKEPLGTRDEAKELRANCDLAEEPASLAGGAAAHRPDPQGAALTEKLRRIVALAVANRLQSPAAASEEDTEENEGVEKEGADEEEDVVHSETGGEAENGAERGRLSLISSTLSTTLLLSELAAPQEDEGVPLGSRSAASASHEETGESREEQETTGCERDSPGVAHRLLLHPATFSLARGSLPPISEGATGSRSSPSPDRLAASTQSEAAAEPTETGDSEAELRKLLARLERVEELHRARDFIGAEADDSGALPVANMQSSVDLRSACEAPQDTERQRRRPERMQSPSPPASPSVAPARRLESEAGANRGVPELSVSPVAGAQEFVFEGNPDAAETGNEVAEVQRQERRRAAEAEAAVAQNAEDERTEREPRDEEAASGGQREEEEWLQDIVAVSRRKAAEARARDQRDESERDARKDTESIAGSEELLEEAWKEARAETRNALLEIHREMKGVALYDGDARDASRT